MSGFETMKSRVNEFLHPSIDPRDTYDPTFLTLAHKRRPVGHSSPCSSLGGTLGGCGSGFSSGQPTARVTSLNSNMNLKSSELVASPSSHQPVGMGPHQQDQWFLHRGKRPDPFGPRHDPSVLTQDERMVQPLDNKGSLSEVRFGKGFKRRSHSAIGAERPRLEAEAARAVLAEERQTLVRQRHADRERPLNPLTWAQTTTSVAYDTINSRATNYAEFNHTATALSTSAVSPALPPQQANNSDHTGVREGKNGFLQPPLYPSSVTTVEKVPSKRVFPDRYATTVGPPTATSSSAAQAQKAHSSSVRGEGGGGDVSVSVSVADGGAQQQQLSKRVQRFRAEGLLRPKDWGVAEQLKCGDGYVLPEIVPTSFPRVSKRQVRPQTVADTRPW